MGRTGRLYFGKEVKMQSEEWIKARLRFLRRTHGKEPNALEYSENEGRIQELEGVLKDKPCETCKRLVEEFKNQYFKDTEWITKAAMMREVQEEKGILTRIHEHLADKHV